MYDNVLLHYVLGCDCNTCHTNIRTSGGVVHIKDLFSAFAQPEYAGSMNVVQVFWGDEGCVGKLCVRRQLARGVHFDLVSGFDVIGAMHQKEVLKYVEHFNCLTVGLGPLFTGFGHWSHFRQYIHPEIWSRSRKVGECLAEFVALVCRMHCCVNGYIFVESPAGSELFRLQCFTAVWDAGEVVNINVPQCAFGLVVDGQSIYNNNVLIAGIAVSIELCRGVNCTCGYHGTLEGRSGSIPMVKFAQVWPREMCQRICTGMQPSTMQRRRSTHCAYCKLSFLCGRCCVWPPPTTNVPQKPRGHC